MAMESCDLEDDDDDRTMPHCFDGAVLVNATTLFEWTVTNSNVVKKATIDGAIIFIILG